VGRRAAAVLLAALAVAPGSAAHAAAPPRTARVVLTTGTRIEWTGVTGVKLTIPRDAQLHPGYGARLYLRGGTYAAVRLGHVGDCGGGRRCGGTSLSIDYTRATAKAFPNGFGPGGDHIAYTTDSGHYPAAVWDLYLFTDGHATLEFDQTGLETRKQAFTAAGRVRGTYRRLPEFCGVPEHCSPATGYYGRARTGGAYGDVGRYGIAEGWVANFSTADPWVPQSHGIRTCAYRVPQDERGPAERNHPLGCDLHPGYADADAVNYVSFGSPQYSAVSRGMGVSDATGRVYMGFDVTTAHDLSGAVYEAYGAWYEYGVR
jgi:hypothetical protein